MSWNLSSIDIANITTAWPQLNATSPKSQWQIQGSHLRGTKRRFREYKIV